jgi:hypothetical protein
MNIIGKKFGRLTVIGPSVAIKQKSKTVLCQCECGAQCVVIPYQLQSGHVRSCGCLKLEINTAQARRLFIKHGKKWSLEYKAWEGIKQRCFNPNSSGWHKYGSRGITVCQDWLKFENFYKDMGDKPSKKHSIERINNDKGYSKENCKWALPVEQARNKRVLKNCATGVPGVYFKNENQKYQARITANGKRISLGYFHDLQEAIFVRLNAEKVYWGRSFPE